MFTRLGKLVTRHPVAIIVVWALLVGFTGAAALWGFGQGGLFQRMETSEYVIPGTDSEKVAHLTSSDEETGPTSIMVVTGVNTDANWDELLTFAEEHRSLFEGEYVDTVADAFMIAQATKDAEDQAQADLEAAIEENTQAALTEVTTQMGAQRAAAEAQIQAQVDQAYALGPEAAAAAQAQADAARAELDATMAAELEAAQTQVKTQVAQEAAKAAEEALNDPEVIAAKADAEAQKQALLPTNGDGYAVIVTRDAGLTGEQTKVSRQELDTATEEYRAALQAEFPGSQIDEMSQDHVESAIMDLVQNDLVKGETLSLPVAALIMIIVFGGALAAGMPLVGAISSIAAGMGALWILTFATTVDSFILNVVSIIGVALSIDYGLLVVSRYREESKRLKAEVDDPLLPQRRGNLKQRVVVPAVETTVETAGRTVTFSAITIAASLIGLLMVRVHMLQMIAWGGIIVALLAVLAAITLIPALLTLAGTKLLKPSPVTRIPGIGRLVNAIGDTSNDHGIFYRIARWVQKRPWMVMVGVATVLILMALPVRGLEMRNHFADYIPEGTGLRTAFDTVQEEYPKLATPSATAIVDASEDSPETLKFVEDVSALPNVASVEVAPLASDEALTEVSVRVDVPDQAGAEVTQVVTDMRALDVGADVWVGGSAATQADFTSALVHDAPWALLVVVIAVMVLLFLMTGSLLVPIRALIINTLSLMAALGITTAIFGNGWFGVQQTPGLETFIVAVMIAFGFGLAMDYEVFLLARIKEYWDAGDDNNTAVAKGLQRSGRIITSAAAIIVAVFIGFAMGEMVAIKQIGIALAVMVVTDATLTRLFLVPATMTVLGKWNWWAPKPLKKLAEKVGMLE